MPCHASSPGMITLPSDERRGLCKARHIAGDAAHCLPHMHKALDFSPSPENKQTHLIFFLCSFFARLGLWKICPLRDSLSYKRRFTRKEQRQDGWRSITETVLKEKERRVRNLQDCTAIQPSSQRMGQDFWEGLWDISGCLLSGIQWGNSRNAWEHVNLVQYALKTQILWVLPRLQNPQEAHSSVNRNPFKEEAYMFCLGQSASWLLPLGYIWVSFTHVFCFFTKSCH